MQPIIIPDLVNVVINNNTFEVTGPKGNVSEVVPASISVEVKGKEIIVKRQNDNQKTKALHGYVRAHLANVVKGVEIGWSKTLTLVGVGFRATTDGKKLTLIVGYSHPVEFIAPEGVRLTIKGNDVTVTGISRQQVGEVAAMVRRVRPPEVYKGKGIRYKNEVVKIKPGKAAKTVGGTAVGATGGAK